MRILILGAGPTGLGAAYRLSLLGCHNWLLYEKEDRVGGLAASYRDEMGFTWDLGGHILFSQDGRFNDLVDLLMGADLLQHERVSCIRTLGVCVPYPFQNNIRYLPKEVAVECLEGLIHARMDGRVVRHFEDWVYKTFGKGIAEAFLIPYNTKVWAMPPSLIDYNWTAQRVSPVNLDRVIENLKTGSDDVDWGPNSRFRFPARDGTGALFSRFLPFLKGRVIYNSPLTGVDMDSKTAFFDERRERYDILINTIPLDRFTAMIRSTGGSYSELKESSSLLKHTGIYVIGIGLRKRLQGRKCWVYTPDGNIPFYRVTYFSHYSPNNVPQGDTDTYGSLMCEISFSEGRNRSLPDGEAIDVTIEGLVKSGILSSGDADLIVSKWVRKVDYAYPVPTLRRDDCLARIHPLLEEAGVFSRGRFGAWKYEIGNMDHCVLMGMELVDRIMLGKEETLWKL